MCPHSIVSYIPMLYSPMLYSPNVILILKSVLYLVGMICMVMVHLNGCGYMGSFSFDKLIQCGIESDGVIDVT